MGRVRNEMTEPGRVRPFGPAYPLSGLWRNLMLPRGLALIALGAGLLAFLPALLVIYTAAGGSFDIIIRMMHTRVPALLLNTFGLMVSVTAVAALIAISMAFLLARTDLPGREALHFFLATPLAIPPYIAAFAYISLIGPAGAATAFFSEAAGFSVEQIPSIYSFGGITFILSLCTFPYIYLLVKPALASLAGRWEEVGRSCGLSLGQVFRRVTLPLIKPAVGAGSLLVSLYVLSDFGAVSMLRFQTFTSSIYLQLIGRYDKVTASVLATVLIALTALLIIFEQRIKGQSKFFQFGSSHTVPDVIKLGKWRYPALAVVLLILLLSVGIPLGMLVYWSVMGIAGGMVDGAFGGYVFNSLLSAFLAATAAMIPAMAIAYLNERYRGIFSSVVNGMSHAGYALPGVVVALGFVLVASRFTPDLYGTLWVLLAAYWVRFLPQGIQACNAAIAQVPPNLEEAGRLAGLSFTGVFARVVFPLIRPGLLAGWALIFLSIIKELPVTLLLRPVSFDTLPVRIWIEASEGYFYLGAPGALLLVLVSMISVVVMSKNGR